MVKECRVLFDNETVAVVKYGDDEIQFPPIVGRPKSVFVKFENGKYSIVNKAEVEDRLEKNNKKTVKKKTTIRESEKDKYAIE